MTPSCAAAVKTVTFDADDTLWHFDSAMRAGLARVLKEIRRIAPRSGPALTVDAMIAARDEAETDLKRSGGSLLAIRREGIRRCLPSGHGDEMLPDRLLAMYQEERTRVMVPYDDVVPALRLLGRDRTLGVVSNGNTHPERCGLGGYFRFVLLSDEHGVEKPDPRVFEMAAEAAGCDVSEIAHVGDRLGTDVEGANRAGAVSVWLNRGEESAPMGGPVPSFTVGTLSQLQGVIDEAAGG